MSMGHWMRLVEGLNAGQAGSVNSLGKPVALRLDAIANFQKWFKGSEAVDTAGRPLVLYHGTTGDFHSFKKGPRYGLAKSGFFFTMCPFTASTYAGMEEKSWGFETEEEYAEFSRLCDLDDQEASSRFLDAHRKFDIKTWSNGGNVMLAYLRILNPLVIDADGHEWDEIPWEDGPVFMDELLGIARKRGHDGMIVHNVRDKQGHGGKAITVFAVHSAKQIKSALGNDGRFGENSRITEHGTHCSDLSNL